VPSSSGQPKTGGLILQRERRLEVELTVVSEIRAVSRELPQVSQELLPAVSQELFQLGQMVILKQPFLVGL
jgi:hypothetical protein